MWRKGNKLQYNNRVRYFGLGTLLNTVRTAGALDIFRFTNAHPCSKYFPFNP